MPWQEVSTVSLRQEFVVLAQLGNVPFATLCKRFSISRKTGYKWLSRYNSGGKDALCDQSRRPHLSPLKTDGDIETAVLALRDRHQAWGGRKIKARLEALGHENIPSPSTITAILRRHGRIEPDEAQKHKPWQRFEHETPNRLWQMDFKGHFPLELGRCHPLTVLDDHSRFALCLKACGNERHETVKETMTNVFLRYGLPERMTMDNGSPWGSDRDHPYTSFTVWLMHLGIRVSHSRPFHPQTQGKDERFHRTLNAELLRNNFFRNLDHCQLHFDHWREVYNQERPHEALGMKTPGTRYAISPRVFPETLPAIEYSPADVVRKVQDGGIIHFKGREFRISNAFKGYPIALRFTTTDGLMEVYFCQQKIADIDLKTM